MTIQFHYYQADRTLPKRVMERMAETWQARYPGSRVFPQRNVQKDEFVTLITPGNDSQTDRILRHDAQHTQHTRHYGLIPIPHGPYSPR
jgi:hypothetical protein